MTTKLSAIAVTATVCGVIGFSSWEKPSEVSALTLDNVDALSQSEPNLGYYTYKWETEYPSRYENGKWIWVEEGGTDCYKDLGSDPECLESYYYREVWR